MTDKNLTTFAAVRIRGGRRINVNVKRTLELLNLNNQHNLVFLSADSKASGMLKKVKDYVTWGEVSPEVMKEIKDKRSDGSDKQKIFRLHPPRGGFERKGMKVAFREGGALGYRADKINDLLKRML